MKSKIDITWPVRTEKGKGSSQGTIELETVDGVIYLTLNSGDSVGLTIKSVQTLLDLLALATSNMYEEGLIELGL